MHLTKVVLCVPTKHPPLTKRKSASGRLETVNPGLRQAEGLPTEREKIFKDISSEEEK